MVRLVGPLEALMIAFVVGAQAKSGRLAQALVGDRDDLAPPPRLDRRHHDLADRDEQECDPGKADHAQRISGWICVHRAAIDPARPASPAAIRPKRSTSCRS